MTDRNTGKEEPANGDGDDEIPEVLRGLDLVGAAADDTIRTGNRQQQQQQQQQLPPQAQQQQQLEITAAAPSRPTVFDVFGSQVGATQPQQNPVPQPQPQPPPPPPPALRPPSIWHGGRQSSADSNQSGGGGGGGVAATRPSALRSPPRPAAARKAPNEEDKKEERDRASAPAAAAHPLDIMAGTTTAADGASRRAPPFMMMPDEAIAQAWAAQQQQPQPQLPLPGHVPKPQHKRTVSWGLDTNQQMPGMPPPPGQGLNRESSGGTNMSSLHQPSLADSPGTVGRRPPDSIGGGGGGAPVYPNPPPPPMPPQLPPRTQQMPPMKLPVRGIPRGQSRRKLTVIDLQELINETSPLEHEAEDSILKAIELRDQQVSAMSTPAAGGGGARARAGTATSSISVIENLPDEAVSLMSGSLMGDEAVATDAPSPVGGGGAHSNDGDSLGHSSDAASSPTASSRLLLSPVPTSKKPKSHRRTLTMEEKLSGLANAMDVIHAQEVADTGDDGAVRRPEADGNALTGSSGSIQRPKLLRARGKSDATAGSIRDFTEDLPYETATPVSNNDAFQRNASILYHRMTKPTGASRDVNAYDDHIHFAGIQPKRRVDPKKDDVIFEDDNENESDDADEEAATLEAGVGDNGASPGKKSGIKRLYRCRCLPSESKFVRELRSFFEPLQSTIKTYSKVVLLYIMIPITGIAAILYYLAGKSDVYTSHLLKIRLRMMSCGLFRGLTTFVCFKTYPGNPPTGTYELGGGYSTIVNGTKVVANTEGEFVDASHASASWWLLFIFVRQLVTLTLALLMQVFIVDFLSVRCGFTLKVLGAWPTLFILQSRGWPFVAFFWAVFDFALLYGHHPFFHNWLYWQKGIGLFNEQNPSGEIVSSYWNMLILTIVLCVSAVVSVKRLLLGLYLGKKTFLQFSDKLATIMKKIVLISEVGYLAWDLEREAKAKKKKNKGGDRSSVVSALPEDNLEVMYDYMEDDASHKQPSTSDWALSGEPESMNTPVIDPNDRHPLTGKLNPSQEARIVQLLGSWEEPASASAIIDYVSVSALLQFRRAIAHLRTDFPFSGSFGNASTREDTIASSQRVYERLLRGSESDECLNFRVLASLGTYSDGTLDQQKLKELIKLFRPDRQGNLSMIDFVKSVDTVYRELRLLRASVDNSSKVRSDSLSPQKHRIPRFSYSSPLTYHLFRLTPRPSTSSTGCSTLSWLSWFFSSWA